MPTAAAGEGRRELMGYYDVKVAAQDGVGILVVLYAFMVAVAALLVLLAALTVWGIGRGAAWAWRRTSARGW